MTIYDFLGRHYIANNWGIYDMHGNVRELVKDYYGSLGKDAVTDPKGPTSGSQRVYRGGSFSDAASACTSSSRGGVSPELGSYYGPDYSSKDIEQQGFRVPSLPVENLKIAFPSKPACVFRMRASYVLVTTLQNGSVADCSSRRSPFVYILARTSIPNALKSVTMSPSDAFSIW